MSKEYNEYLFKHKVFVCVGYYFLENLYSPDSSGRTKFYRDLQIVQLFLHDKSKMSMTEYGPYDKYFYSKDELDQQAIDDYKFAWLNHIHKNPHHWQHWVLVNDDDGVEALPMTRSYILELLCDWMSFDITPIEPYGTFKFDAKKLKKYWKDHENKIILHPSTRSSIKYMIDKLAKAYGENGTVHIEPEVLDNICEIVQKDFIYGTFKFDAKNFKKYWKDHENKIILNQNTVHIEPEVLNNICKIVQKDLKLCYPNKFCIEVEKTK